MPTTSSRWWNNCWRRLPSHERSRVAPPPATQYSTDGKAGARMSRVESALTSQEKYKWNTPSLGLWRGRLEHLQLHPRHQ